MRQQETIDAYARQMGAKANAWLSGNDGCTAFLMRGVERFHDTVQAVSLSQTAVLDNLRETRDAALKSALEADAHRRRIASLADRLDREGRLAEQRSARRAEDDLTASRVLSGNRR